MKTEAYQRLPLQISLLSKPEDKKSIPIEDIRAAKDFLQLKTNKKNICTLMREWILD
ncbi:MAG: hypothetical protein CM15mP12_0160 [Gammaproteobacteria bacterium]|nr:MAG: hypothetical protein CM15mP12_0160 [Gammaproteobacteria bacterium]